MVSRIRTISDFLFDRVALENLNLNWMRQLGVIEVQSDNKPPCQPGDLVPIDFVLDGRHNRVWCVMISHCIIEHDGDDDRDVAHMHIYRACSGLPDIDGCEGCRTVRVPASDAPGPSY